MASRNVKISTYNCRGIGNGSKRRTVFKWLKHFHKGITLIQETHSVEKNRKVIGKKNGRETFILIMGPLKVVELLL